MYLKIFTLYQNKRRLFDRIPMRKRPISEKIMHSLDKQTLTIFVLFLCFILLLVVGILGGDIDLIRLESSSL